MITASAVELLHIAKRLDKLSRDMSRIAKRMRAQPIITKEHADQLGGSAGLVARWAAEIRRIGE